MSTSSPKIPDPNAVTHPPGGLVDDPEGNKIPLEDTEGEKRRRKLTGKAKAFQIQTLFTQMKRLKNRLIKQVEIITTVLEAGSTELINKEINNMEKIYSEYTEAYARSCGLAAEFAEEDTEATQQHEEISMMMEEVDSTYMDCKTKVCNHLLLEEKSRHSDGRSSAGSSKSNKSKSSRSSSRSGKSSGSNHSKLSSKSVRQKAKVAGLKAEAESLKKTKEAEFAVEMSRLEQKIKKAEAMEKVYARYEEELVKGEDRVEQNVKGDHLSTNVKNPVAKDNTGAKRSQLNIQEHDMVNNPANENMKKTHLKKAKKYDDLNYADTAQLQHTMIDMLRVQAAPKPDLDEFTGDPLEYLYFKANFREVVETAVNDQVGRLTRLIKYTAGEAKELIKHLVHADPDNCYDVAISLLDKEYGNPHLISVSYLNKLRSWENIKENDSSAYKALYRFLLKCQVYKKGSQLLELDSTEMIRTIVTKLPPSHQNRWGRKAVDLRNSHSREVDFDDLIKFIAKEEEILSDPAYSRDALADVPQVKSNATRCGKSSVDCPLCNLEHDIEDCEDFLAKDVDQRHKTVFQRNMCFSCLKTIDTGHTGKTCREPRRCRVCNGTHPTTLHGGKGTTVHHTSLQDNVISMCVVPVQLWHIDHPENKINVYCLLDDCSQGTFIKDDVLDDLNISGQETSLTTTTINAKSTEPSVVIKKNKLVVQCMPQHAQLYPPSAIKLPVTFSRSYLAVDPDEIPTPGKIRKWPYLETLVDKIPEFDPSLPIGLMIGGNCPQALTPLEAIEDPHNIGPFAKRSRLGWCIVGPISSNCESNIKCNNTRIIATKDITTGSINKHYFTVTEEVHETPASEMLKEMYATEFNEKASEKQALSQEDEQFLEIMRNGARNIHGRMEVPLPFRNANVMLPNNRHHVMMRLLSMKNRFIKNPERFREYSDVMDRTIKMFAQPVDKSEEASGKVWYTAHHAVRNEQKGKLRVVFNPSELFQGRCLNDELLQGPDLANKLVGVLIRFRKESIALMADIEAMFYQVQVPKQQRSFLRFLWWENSNLNSSIRDYEMRVHMFGVISSGGCCNYALQKTADDFKDEYGPEASQTIRWNFYIHDLLKSVYGTGTAK